jgi:hypothetical protein
MKVRLFKILFCLIVVMIPLFNTIPVLAISTSPTTITINHVYAYENALELNDMLFWADYTTPTEAISSAYNLRLVDSSGTEIKSKAPYAYFQNGFSQGLCAIYFTAAEVVSESLTWGSVLYYMRLDGNPTASWSGGGSIPSASPIVSSSFSWKTTTTVGATQALIEPDILVEAQSLQTKWASTSYILITSVLGASKLSNTGEAYFGNVLPTLSALAPDVLLSATETLNIIPDPTLPTDTYSTGTIAVTNGSIEVVGSGVDWILDMQGGTITIAAVDYTVSNITSTTTLLLTAAYAGVTASGLSYTLTYPHVEASNIGKDFAGTALDLSDAADAMHIGGMWLGIVITCGVIIFVMIHGTREANSYKPAILIVIPLLYIFTRIGWFPMLLTVGLGLFAAFAIWYTVFYEKTSS